MSEIKDSRTGMNSISVSRLQSAMLDDEYHLSSCRRRVRFADPIVSEMRERPCSLEKDLFYSKKDLFYSKKDYTCARKNQKAIKNILETASVKISVSTSETSSISSKSSNIPSHQSPYKCTNSILETVLRNLAHVLACTNPNPAFGDEEYDNNWSGSYAK